MKKKTLSLLLTLVTIISLFTGMGLSASAANCSTSYGSFSTPSSSDYAYWSGTKVVKASGTTVSEIKWMQAALNYCIKYKGLNASYLDVDGSFGPASKKTTIAFQTAAGLTKDGSFGPSTIARMKDVLSGRYILSTEKSSPIPSSKITTAQIQNILTQYGYSTGKYWVYSSGGSAYSGYKASSTNRGRSYSYVFQGAKECSGFAIFVMSKVTGKADVDKKYGWTKLTGNQVTDLRVGDIVRAGGHSAIVLSVDNSGKCTFAECWGSVNCKIVIGGGFNGQYYTLSAIKSAYTNSFSHVWRYTG